MRTIRTKLYKFNELTSEAKKKAIKAHEQVISQDPDILYGFEDYCKERGKENGFYINHVRYSLSYSQGDGVSFSSQINLAKFIKKVYPDIKASLFDVLTNYCTCTTTQNKRTYAFASRHDVDLSLDSRNECENLQTMVFNIASTIKDAYMALCNQLGAEGYAWIESRYEEASIVEELTSNDYEFLKDGTKY